MKQFDKLVSIADSLDLKGLHKEAHLIDVFLYKTAILKGTREQFEVQNIISTLEQLQKLSLLSKIEVVARSGKTKNVPVNLEYLKVLSDLEKLVELTRSNEHVQDKRYKLFAEICNLLFLALQGSRPNFVQTQSIKEDIEKDISTIKESFNIRVKNSEDEEGKNLIDNANQTLNKILEPLETLLSREIVNIKELEAVIDNVADNTKAFISAESKGDDGLKGLFIKGRVLLSKDSRLTIDSILDKARKHPGSELALIAEKYIQKKEEEKSQKNLQVKHYTQLLESYQRFKNATEGKISEGKASEEIEKACEQIGNRDYMSLMEDTERILATYNPGLFEKKASFKFANLGLEDEEEALNAFPDPFDESGKIKKDYFQALSPSIPKDFSNVVNISNQLERLIKTMINRSENLKNALSTRYNTVTEVEKLKENLWAAGIDLQKDQYELVWTNILNKINRSMLYLKSNIKKIIEMDKKVKDFGNILGKVKEGIYPVLGLEV